MNKGRKYRVLLVCLFVCLLSMTACGDKDIDIKNIQGVSLQVLEDDGDIVHTSISKEDVISVRDILVAGDKETDKGFVFASGCYRLSLQIDGESINLYPYCGQLSKLKIGDDGYTYITIDEEKAKMLQEIVSQYITVTTGIYEWD